MADAILVVLLSIVALTVLARSVGLPEPLMFLVGGICLSVVPGLPRVHYDANVVFLLFFPVLLFSAAFGSSWNDLRPNAAPIVRSALGIVLTTTLLVGVVAHLLIGALSWPEAFLLGAILADPDFRVFFALAQKTRVTRPMRVILGNEGLFEGTAQLVLYIALSGAVTTGALTASTLIRNLLLGPILGFAIGLAGAWTLGRLDRYVRDPTLSTVLLLAAPFVAYIPASAVGGNRITAVVAAGLYLGWTRDMTASTLARLGTPVVWALLVLIVDGFIYLPAGLALPDAIGHVHQGPLELIGWLLALTAAGLAARLTWALGVEGALGALRRRNQRGPQATWGELGMAGWAATRGAFALASALALPLVTKKGAPFPDRDLLIALSLGVVLVSVTVQGTLMPVLLRRLQLPKDSRTDLEEALAWRTTAQSALDRLEKLGREQRVPKDMAAIFRLHYQGRLDRYAVAHGAAVAPPTELAVARELLAAERQGLGQLRDENRISETVFRKIQREQDLADEYYGT